ncbi:helix-turn-helix domain-containing protein [Burkholderia stagnalis]
MSRAVKAPEEDLGVRLFIRATRSNRLSRAGQISRNTCVGSP